MNTIDLLKEEFYPTCIETVDTLPVHKDGEYYLLNKGGEFIPSPMEDANILIMVIGSGCGDPECPCDKSNDNMAYILK